MLSSIKSDLLDETETIVGGVIIGFLLYFVFVTSFPSIIYNPLFGGIYSGLALMIEFIIFRLASANISLTKGAFVGITIIGFLAYILFFTMFPPIINNAMFGGIFFGVVISLYIVLDSMKDYISDTSVEIEENVNNKSNKFHLNRQETLTILVIILTLMGLFLNNYYFGKRTEFENAQNNKLDELKNPKPYFIIDIETHYATGTEIKDFFVNNDRIGEYPSDINLTIDNIYFIDILKVTNRGEDIGEDISGTLNLDISALDYEQPINIIFSSTELELVNKDGNKLNFNLKLGKPLHPTEGVYLYVVFEKYQQSNWKSTGGVIYSRNAGGQYVSDSDSDRSPLPEILK
ncbi:MAG: hypothetical protein V3V92_06895 [Candidatus Hydrothermarchaeales archaeon]